MPNIEVKLRRGTTSQHTGFTGAVGEVTVDTDKDTVVVHDGSTAGGHELRKKADTIAGSEIADNAITSDKISDTDAQFLVDDTSAQKKIVINDALGDVDFIVKSIGNGNLIITDGANNAVGIGTTADSNFILTVGNTALSSSLVVYDPLSTAEGGQININKAGQTTPSLNETDGFIVDTFNTGAATTYGLPNNTDVLRLIGTPGSGAAEKSVVMTEDADLITNGDIKFKISGENSIGQDGIEADKIHSKVLALTDGITEPDALTSGAAIYVDSSDGDLKIKFSDGTVKTIVTDS